MPSLTKILISFLLCFMQLCIANDALDYNTNTQNGKHVEIAITTWGSDFYYAIMSTMGATTLGILVASAWKPRSDRIFFYLCAAICGVATIAYFAMGSNLGWTPIDVEFTRTINGVAGRNREIFYARYIDWSAKPYPVMTSSRQLTVLRFITTPLLLLDLLLTAGLPWPTVLWTIALDIIMVVTGLLGALVKTRYKWGKR